MTSKISMYDGPSSILSASEISTEMVLERYTSQNWRILFSCRRSWLWTTKKTVPDPRTNELSKIEDFCKTSFWSNDENSKFQSPERSCWEKSSDQDSKRKEKITLTGRWENASSGKQMHKVRKETHVVSVVKWPLDSNGAQIRTRQ